MSRLILLALVIGIAVLGWYYGGRWLQARRDEEHRLRQAEEALRRAERFELQPGGAPNNPLGVSSPSVVEVKAAKIKCPICGRAFSVEQHRAESIGGVNLRIADVRCAECGSEREIYFQLQQ